MGVRESLDPDASMWDWIACDLRFYREKAGDTGTKIGKLINRTRQSVSNMEAGRSGYRLTEKGASILDAHWNTNGHFGRLLRYARTGHDPHWFKEYMIYEARASVIKTWELAWIPGLLQTEEYARASLMAGGERDVESLVEARMIRKGTLTRENSPTLWVLIWEPALETRVGGSHVMRSQLGDLLALSEGPDVNIRVVPKGSGSHLGMDGAFKLLTLPSEDVAFVEAPGGGRLVTSGSEVRSYALRYDRIGQEALPVGSSRDLISRIMEAMK